MKKLLLVLVVLVGVAGVTFAQDWAASYNKPGDVNLYASFGYYWWPEVSVAAEFVIGEFAIGPIPLDWGVAVRGGVDFWSGGVDFGVGALGTLHFGLGVFPVEFYASLGVCYNNYWATPISIASFGGATWWFSKNLGLLFENGYLGSYFWGVGVEFKI
jgi:hypothetical protein